jgi:hypothetical protein
MIMTYHKILNLVLIGMVLSLGSVAAVSAADSSADLSLTKSVTSAGPYYAGTTVQWLITLRNNGPDNATNVTVVEDVSGLLGVWGMHVQESTGSYNAISHEWKIPQLDNDTAATLILNTTFRTPGDKINRVAVASLSETDPDWTNNNASATVHLNETPVGAVCSETSLKVSPETMNIHSNGVFTVSIALSCLSGNGKEGVWGEGAYNLHQVSIDTAHSSLVCNGATPVQWMGPDDGGKSILAKFQRSDLVDVSAGTQVEINCSGTLVVAGQTIPVSGSDTIRIIDQEGGWHSLFARILSVLHLVDKNQDGQIDINDGINISPPLNLSDLSNLGFLKGFHAHPFASVPPALAENESMRHAQEQLQQTHQDNEQSENRTADEHMKQHQIAVGAHPNREDRREDGGR